VNLLPAAPTFEISSACGACPSSFVKLETMTPACSHKHLPFQRCLDYAQIPHLVELGVTAVEILPVFEYDELEFQRSPNPRVSGPAASAAATCQRLFASSC